MSVKVLHRAALELAGFPAVRFSVATGPPTGAWEAVYQADPGALPSQSMAWARAISLSGAFRDDSRYYEFADGRRAVLPLFSSWSAVGGYAPAYSPPSAWGFGGPVADGPLTAAHLDAILGDLERRRSLIVHIRPNPLHASLWTEAAGPDWTAIPRLAHILDLSGGYETVWNSRFRPNVRNFVRRAERTGVEIETGCSELLVDEFYGLLCLSFERWARKQNEPPALARWRGMRRDPHMKFVKLASALGPKLRLFVARLDGKPIAAILVLMDRQAHYTRGAMDEALAKGTNANYLLHSMAIRTACDQGCTVYNMGETGGSASLAHFKSRFGAVAVPYAEYRRERLPILAVSTSARNAVKRAIGFRDA